MSTKQLVHINGPHAGWTAIVLAEKTENGQRWLQVRDTHTHQVQWVEEDNTSAVPIPGTIYRMVDNYSSASANPVSAGEREPIALYFSAVVQLLMRDGATLHDQNRLAMQYGINPQRIIEIGVFLAQWGKEEA